MPADDEHRNTYSLNIACDCDGSDFTEIEDDYSEYEVDELFTLMVAYFNLDEYTIPKKWKNDLSIDTIRSVFAGKGIQRNDRFDTMSEYMWLSRYADEHGLLLYNSHGALCQNILGINVIYFDDKCHMMDCSCPDLGEYFESEDEFIEYVHMLAGIE